ncbi:SDR family oxidoreductase [Nonomuraea sp. NPDC002799]
MTVTYDYAGKVVLVTGGTKGIGLGIARAFRTAGAEVVVCARTPPGPSWAQDLRFVQADVRDPADVERLLSGLGRLDVLVNNAGGGPNAPLAGTSPRLHARIIELNLTAPLLVSQQAYPLLAAARGAVIMIGSVSGARPSPGTSAYGAAKAGLHHLARCLAAEWAPSVRVNTVVVGLAATETTTEHYERATEHSGETTTEQSGTAAEHFRRATEHSGTAAEHFRRATEHSGTATEHLGPAPERSGAAADGESPGMAGIAATIPAGRMATPGDVARACLWLAAPGYVTGAEVRVDGGGETPAWRHLTAAPAPAPPSAPEPPPAPPSSAGLPPATGLALGDIS